MSHGETGGEPDGERRTKPGGANLTLPTGDPLVDVERSGVVESIHRGHLIGLGAAGEVVFTAGRPDVAMFVRSCMKPIQAVALLDLDVALTDAQAALAAASHTGTAVHVDTVRSTLTAYDLTEDDLACPRDWPLDDDAMRAAPARARIFMNCSGKHAAMLAACRVNGWPTAGYLHGDHPVQQHIAATVTAWAGPIAAIGVDGCGAPLFAVSLAGLAGAFHRLAHATDGSAGQVAAAMQARPELVAGPGQATTRLLAGVPRSVVKNGAEGVFAAAVRGIGAVAVKIDDGAARAAEVSVVAGLSRLELRAAALDEMATIAILGGDQIVGSIRPHRHSH